MTLQELNELKVNDYILWTTINSFGNPIESKLVVRSVSEKEIELDMGHIVPTKHNKEKLTYYDLKKI